MKYVVWILVAVLVVLHQDVWFWDDPRLLFGFLPVGLAYHMALSVAAAGVWLFAVLFAWPVDAEAYATTDAPSTGKEAKP